MQNEFKSLGNLTHGQKLPIWKGKVSGSQVKRIFNEPVSLWNEKMGNTTPYNLESDEKLAVRLAMGNYMEDNIINLAKISHDLDIVIDKETHQSTNFEYRTANIDGYLGKSINDLDYIIEVKNTTRTSIKELIEFYLPQLDYYMWFYNAKVGGKFLFFINGYDLQVITITRDKKREEAMLAKLNAFETCLALGIEPIENQLVPEGSESIEVDSEDWLETVDELAATQAKIKELKKKEDEIKKDITGLFGNNVGSIYGSDKIYKRIAVKRSGKVDYQRAFYELAEKVGEDALKLEESYSGKSTITYQLRSSKRRK